MILDMNGNLKEIPKKNKRNNKLTSEKLVIEVGSLLEKNADNFFVFFCKEDIKYQVKNCTGEQMSELIDELKTIKLRESVFEWLDDYFYGDYTEKREEDLEIIKQQEIIEKLIQEHFKNKNDKDD